MKVIEKESLDACILDLLQSVNFKRNTKGRKFLLSAIRKYYIDPVKYHRNIYKDLYNEVAAEFQTRPMCVEKNIRKALESAWTKGDPRVQYEYYGSIISTNEDKPTAAPFIVKSVEIIKRRLR